MRPAIPPNHREELLRRRQRLKEFRVRQSLEQQRQNLIATLDQAGVVYAIVADAPLVSWISYRFKVDKWSSIDWSGVQQKRQVDPRTLTSSNWLRSLDAAGFLDGSDVAVVYAEGAYPSLTMSIGELVKHADVIVDAAFQTWVFDPNREWIIEFHHDLGWCWGMAA